MKQEFVKLSEATTESGSKTREKVVKHAYQALKELITRERLNSLSLPELKELLAGVDCMLASYHSESRARCIINNINNRYNREELLEWKKIILDRIQELSSNEKIENLQELIEQLTDGEIKEKLTEELNALQKESIEYKKEILYTSEAEAKIKLDQQKIDGLERKSKIWLSFLQRESAASLIGAIVLLLLTLALIFGKESQILSNGFLVILGYFFGQSSTRTRQDNNKYDSTQNNSPPGN